MTDRIADVVIIGAGPTGLTLACDLARRGVRFTIIDRLEQPFAGSRAKGVQPRTQEVFDDLGALEALIAAGGPYPRMNAHLWIFSLKWRMHKTRGLAPDVPYPNILLVPQWRTEQVLRDRLAQLGHQVLQGVEVVGLEQADSHVAISVRQESADRALCARYVVAADGGRSFVRKALGLGFVGTTLPEGRMIVGDLQVEGLSRDHWHAWPAAKGGPIGLCPLPGSNLFQLMMTLKASEEAPELTEGAIQARWIAATGQTKIRLHAPTWLSLFRPSVRMVERYRCGRVFLAGDAAHIHPPAGALGLNTGIQDAYNLGWKLHLALAGASDSLLDTYQEERLPVAAGVLGLSSKLFETHQSKPFSIPRRGDEERQLLLNYRSSSLSAQVGRGLPGLQAGDRAPNAPCLGTAGQSCLYDIFRGPHFTLLIFGDACKELMREFRMADLRTAVVLGTGTEGAVGDEVIDPEGTLRSIYGVQTGRDAVIVVRPDGYVGLIATEDWISAVSRYMKKFATKGINNDRTRIAFGW